MAHETDEAAILSWWDNGAIVAEQSDDETVACIAKELHIKDEDVRAVLVAAGRIEEGGAP